MVNDPSQTPIEIAGVGEMVSGWYSIGTPKSRVSALPPTRIECSARLLICSISSGLALCFNSQPPPFHDRSSRSRYSRIAGVWLPRKAVCGSFSESSVAGMNSCISLGLTRGFSYPSTTAMRVGGPLLRFRAHNPTKVSSAKAPVAFLLAAATADFWQHPNCDRGATAQPDIVEQVNRAYFR